MKSFASDNYAGVLPEIMDALIAANTNHAPAYGNDPLTQSTKKLINDVFETDADIYFVFNGTGANVLSVSAASQSFNAVLCADTSHILNDESSAPETFTGCRFYPVSTDEQGKINIDALKSKLIRKGDLHYPQPSILSVSQSTEYGTVYSIEEIQQLSQICKKHQLYLHMDGARFFNAVAALGCNPSEISNKAGVDIISLGGTKLGMMFGEAVLVFNPELKKNLQYKHKQSMQLASKSRFIAAQFQALLSNQLWQKAALHANSMAHYLSQNLSQFNSINITRQQQANAVFACIPRHWNALLTSLYPFYVWREDINEVRLMCAWDTQKEEIDQLIEQIKLIATQH